MARLGRGRPVRAVIRRGAGTPPSGVTVGQALETDAAQTITPHKGSEFPLRGAFYYSWFDETWTVGGEPIKYNPTLGLYDLDAATADDVYDQHIAWMEYAGLDVAIMSWWEQDDGNLGLTGGDHNEGTRIPLFIDRLEAAGSPFKFCMYYEEEGFGDPSVAQIQSDLNYIRTNYVTRPDYLFVDGKPVMFVYNSGDTAGANALQRWSDATNGFTDWYMVMKIFTGYTSATPQPNSWHQYGPATREQVHTPYSYVISPGYWQANDPDPPGTEFPYLARSVRDFNTAIRNMIGSGNDWQLVTTFNEWGEGTAIEPASEFGTDYLDALHTDGTLILPGGETDLAQTVARVKARTMGQTAETDLAQTVSPDVPVSGSGMLAHFAAMIGG